MLKKISIEKIREHLNFLKNDMNISEGGIECWLDLYRKEFKEKIGKYPKNKELLLYIQGKY